MAHSVADWRTAPSSLTSAPLDRLCAPRRPTTSCWRAAVVCADDVRPARTASWRRWHRYSVRMMLLACLTVLGCDATLRSICGSSQAPHAPGSLSVAGRRRVPSKKQTMVTYLGKLESYLCTTALQHQLRGPVNSIFEINYVTRLHSKIRTQHAVYILYFLKL